MEVLECRGRKVKISKGSITVKTDSDKTCGIVRDIISLHDIQPNKQSVYYTELRKKGLNAMQIGLRNIIIKDNTIYFFKNIKSKLFHEKYGYILDEKEKEEERDEVYRNIEKMGYVVIKCIYT